MYHHHEATTMEPCWYRPGHPFCNSFLCICLYVVVWMWNACHRLTCLNTWPLSDITVRKVMSSLGTRILREDLSFRSWVFGVYSQPYFLLLAAFKIQMSKSVLSPLSYFWVYHHSKSKGNQEIIDNEKCGNTGGTPLTNGLWDAGPIWAWPWVL